MICCVTFDFDGTLVDSNQIKRAAYYEASAGFDAASVLLDGILAASAGKTRFEVLDALARRLEPADTAAATELASRLVERYEALTTGRIIACPEIDGARAALTQLFDRGLALYIASATPQAPLERIVTARDLGRFFKRVFGAPSGKADSLHTICTEEGISPAQLVMVGDRDEDRDAAHDVGCRFVGILGNDDGFQETPEVTVRDLRHLLAVFE